MRRFSLKMGSILFQHCARQKPGWPLHLHSVLSRATFSLLLDAMQVTALSIFLDFLVMMGCNLPPSTWCLPGHFIQQQKWSLDRVWRHWQVWLKGDAKHYTWTLLCGNLVHLIAKSHALIMSTFNPAVGILLEGLQCSGSRRVRFTKPSQALLKMDPSKPRPHTAKAVSRNWVLGNFEHVITSQRVPEKWCVWGFLL